MTDKLPEWLESWLDENSIHPFAGSSFRAVSTYDLRAFLAQFVLCSRPSVAVMHKGTFELKLAPDGDYWGTNWAPLHTPAKGLPEASDTQEQTR